MLHPCCCSGLYDALEVVGSGSTGTVYRACRRLDGEEVALKVMRMSGEELLATAEKEFRLLQSINHPRIIQAHDFFTYPHGAVLVLDYFHGQRLEDIAGHG